VADELNLSMFRAYDIRTPSALLTPELAERLARAEARYLRDGLGAPGVVIAHDARRTGPHYLGIATEVFRRAGLEVVYWVFPWTWTAGRVKWRELMRIRIVRPGMNDGNERGQ
jgi:phosphomannomutase